MDVNCEIVEAVSGRMLIEEIVFFVVDTEVEVCMASVIMRSQAIWWAFNPSLLMFTASVTFADAFDWCLLCSGTHTDIEGDEMK